MGFTDFRLGYILESTYCNHVLASVHSCAILLIFLQNMKQCRHRHLIELSSSPLLVFPIPYSPFLLCLRVYKTNASVAPLRRTIRATTRTIFQHRFYPVVSNICPVLVHVTIARPCIPAHLVSACVART